MELLILRVFLVLVASIVSTYSDIKTGLIYDFITYPLILIGIILAFFEPDFLTIFLIGIIVFLIGYVFYFLGKIGGGDVKLFVGISVVLPFYFGQIFLLTSLFWTAFVSVTLISMYFVGKYAVKGINVDENKDGIKRAIIFGLFLVLYFLFSYFNGIFPIQAIIFLVVPSIFALLFLAFEKGIRKNFFLTFIKVSELEEDEIVAIDAFDKKILEKLNLGNKGILEDKDVKLLKKLNVKKVPVYKNLPKFAPFILFGIICALFLPNLITSYFLFF